MPLSLLFLYYFEVVAVKRLTRSVVFQVLVIRFGSRVLSDVLRHVALLIRQSLPQLLFSHILEVCMSALSLTLEQGNDLIFYVFVAFYFFGSLSV